MTYICCLQEIHLRTKESPGLKVKGWNKNIPCKWKQTKKERAGIATPISDKIDFKTKAIIKDGRSYVILKGSIQLEDITLVNIYAPNIVAPKYIKKILVDFKGEVGSNTIIVGDFNTPLSSMDRSFRQKINMETATLNNTLD